MFADACAREDTMRQKMKKRMQTFSLRPPLPAFAKGYDPELLIVECARCGRPVLWESGRSTEMLAVAGVDPLELDAHCLLLTDGCLRCRPQSKEAFNVQVFRVAPDEGQTFAARPAGVA